MVSLYMRRNSYLMNDFGHHHFQVVIAHGNAFGLGKIGRIFPSGELDDALEKLAEVFKDMLELAQVEKTTQMLAQEIEKTRRRVNALEYVMIPELEQNIRYISMKLDENESSTKVRLMKVKEMVLEDAHHYKQ